ncbi:MAG: hypothetical protein LC772_09640 [Chloroflexi bacterium]|nr:hypothetical protein [Chloroflexota bacterium]
MPASRAGEQRPRRKRAARVTDALEMPGAGMPGAETPGDELEAPRLSRNAPPGESPPTHRREERSNSEIAAITRDAALRVDGVTSVGGCGSGSTMVVTYGLPGRSVRGVLVSRTPEELRVELHISARPVPLPALAESVRQEVESHLTGLAPRCRVDVCIDALDDLP